MLFFGKSDLVNIYDEMQRKSTIFAFVGYSYEILEIITLNGKKKKK